MPVEKPEAPVVIPCTMCATSTHHQVIHRVERSGGDCEIPFYWNTEHQVVECQGCKSLSFRYIATDSDSHFGPADSDYFIEEQLYPYRVEGRRVLEDTHYLPSNVRRVYSETQRALAGEQPVLTGIGIRAIIEAVCTDMEAGGGNLQERIDDLVHKGLLTADGASVLHKLRSLGNEAVHEVKPHKVGQLSLAMDVVDHLLQGAYIFPEKANSTFM